MKKAFIAGAAILGMIIVRMILSVTFTEQAAEIFTKTSISILFFYFLLSMPKGKAKATD
ncbi:MAG: hypothetical protein HFI62_07250 [Lachnospiraceae bacterium]|jgi:hypothetical protein|nr:hypothetical protein [Lachnospiraceae bacterium]